MSDSLPDYESDTESTFAGDFCFRIEFSFFFAIQGGALDEILQRDSPSWARTLASRQLKYLLSEYIPEGVIVGDLCRMKESIELLDLETTTDTWCVVVPPITDALSIEAARELANFSKSKDVHQALPSTSRIFKVILSSPAFTFDQWHDFMDQLRDLLKRLNTFHSSPTSSTSDAHLYGHYAWTNESDHLKASISSHEETHFSQLTLQNLIVVWSRYAKPIERLLPPHRRYFDAQWNQNVPRPLLKHPINPATVDEFRSTVYAAIDAGKLEDVFEPAMDRDLRTKITFRTFRADGPDPGICCNEIHFREPAGTLLIQDISFWVSFVSTVFKFSRDLSALNLKFDTVWEPPYINALLDLINASSQARDYCDTISLYN